MATCGAKGRVGRNHTFTRGSNAKRIFIPVREKSLIYAVLNELRSKVVLVRLICVSKYYRAWYLEKHDIPES